MKKQLLSILKLKSILHKLIYPLSLSIVLCALPLDVQAANEELDVETKSKYYQEYLKIAETISQSENIPVRVIPMEEFQEDNWVTPEEFEDSISKTLDAITVSPATEAVVLSASSRSIASKTKNTSITINNSNYSISITGSFNTQYNSTTGRQQFSSTSSITSSIGGAASWNQSSYDSTFIDGNRTAVVYVTGYIRPIGSSTEYQRTCSVEFYCNENGSIS